MGEMVGLLLYMQEVTRLNLIPNESSIFYLLVLSHKALTKCYLRKEKLYFLLLFMPTHPPTHLNV